MVNRAGNVLTKATHMSLPMVISSGRPDMVAFVPPHLEGIGWLKYESDTALSLCDQISKELSRLVERVSVKRVHEARVVLRTWDSVWEVLKQDHWQSKRYEKNLGKRIHSLRGLLGRLRDWDVNIEIGKSHKLPQYVLDKWSKKRERVHKKVRSHLKKWNVQRLGDDLRSYVKKRRKKIKAKLKKSFVRESAYVHLDLYLTSQEEMAKDLAIQAESVEDLHMLRLCIKGWRYLLTEFFGVTNLQLVRAQQLLGKVNDIERVLSLLRETKIGPAKRTPERAIRELEEQKQIYLNDFEEFRYNLPYGLRPAIVSSIGSVARIRAAS
jgi:CHAD domain-containing protein